MTDTRANVSQILTRWLVGADIFLAAIITWELALSFVPSGNAAASEEFGIALPDHDSIGFALPAAHELADLTERPLFSSTRRPFEASAAEAPEQAAATPPPALVLIGTVIAPGKRSALFTTRSTRQLIQLDIGMSNGDWELVEVSTDKAVFQRDDTRHEIVLAQ